MTVEKTQEEHDAKVISILEDLLTKAKNGEKASFVLLQAEDTEETIETISLVHHMSDYTMGFAVHSLIQNNPGIFLFLLQASQSETENICEAVKS